MIELERKLPRAIPLFAASFFWIACGGGGNSPTGPITISSTGTITPSASIPGLSLYEDIGIELPADKDVLFVTAKAQSAATIAIGTVTAPTGLIYFDVSNETGLEGVRPGGAAPSALGLFLPSTDRVNGTLLGPGRYPFDFFSNANVPIDIEVYAYQALAENATGLINLNVHLGVSTGISAAEAPNNQAMTEFLTKIDDLLQPGDLALRRVRFFDVANAAYDDLELQTGEYFTLFSTATDSEQNDLDLFLIDGFLDNGIPTGVVGISGGIPGPYHAAGFPTAGVAIAWSAITNVYDPLFAGVIAAHELGHYLGLFHTTESFSPGEVDENGDPITLGPRDYDPIEDTVECAPGDGQSTSAGNCVNQGTQYVMFWLPQGGATEFSPSQQAVMHRNPHVLADDTVRWSSAVQAHVHRTQARRYSPDYLMNHRMLCGNSR